MTNRTHRFRIGQTVDLVHSAARMAARGHYEIVSLRPNDGGGPPQYRIKSRSEAHERVVTESELMIPGN
jgi:hypothetical protein